MKLNGLKSWRRVGMVTSLCLAAFGPANSVSAEGEQPAVSAETPSGKAVTPVKVRFTERPATLGEELAERLDPEVDGWRTEILSDVASRRSQLLTQWLETGHGDLSGLVGDDFSATPLRPLRLEEIAVDGATTVRRWDGASQGAELRGLEGLVQALAVLVDGLGGGDEVHAKIKPIRIETGETEFETTLLFEASRSSATGKIQQNGTWRSRWTVPPEGSSEDPRLLALELASYEEVELRHPAGTLFVDVTAAAMGANEAYRQQVLPGLGHWLPRISRVTGMSIVGHHGLAVGDADGDGLEDLYITEAAGLPNRLYLQNLDGTLRDVSSDAGVDWLESSASALLVDLDGDGDQDLAVATVHRLLISENDGRGIFTLRTVLPEPVISPTSLSAADPDADGDLDLFLCGYNGERDSRAIPGPVPYHDARNGGRNVFLENRGDFRFEDMTAAVGLEENNHSFSFAAAWEDYDTDGDVDLYVANDFGRNNLYRNDGGRFRDVAAEAAVEDVASGMSAAWGDIDRDGHSDLYISNMFSSAGNRVAYQRQFASGAGDETLADIRRMARGNTLFHNQGDGTFDDVSLEAGVHLGLWAWASKFADLNNDGWQDLVVSNGYMTNEGTADL